MENKIILGIIPARYASTRFPGKPLVDIGGQTMIQRVYSRASAALTHVVVATDDERIAAHVLSFGGQVIMTAVDHKTGTDRCVEALHKWEAVSGLRCEVVINIQGDEPFIQPQQLEKLKECFEHEITEIATLVKPISSEEELHNPNLPKVVLNAKGGAMYFSRSVVPYQRGVALETWHLSHTYYKHIGIYAYRRSTLIAISQLASGKLEVAESLEQIRWLENGLYIQTQITDLETIGIDTPEDLERVKQAGLI